jgi:hypothetical protein
MNLRRRQPRSIGVDHGFDHVIDQMPDFRCSKIGNRGGDLIEDRVAHAGDLQDHGLKYGTGTEAGQRPKSVNSGR